MTWWLVWHDLVMFLGGVLFGVLLMLIGSYGKDRAKPPHHEQKMNPPLPTSPPKKPRATMWD